MRQCAAIAVALATATQLNSTHRVIVYSHAFLGLPNAATRSFVRMRMNALRIALHAEFSCINFNTPYLYQCCSVLFFFLVLFSFQEYRSILAYAFRTF